MRGLGCLKIGQCVAFAVLVAGLAEMSAAARYALAASANLRSSRSAAPRLFSALASPWRSLASWKMSAAAWPTVMASADC
jgi:hypothetical protein